jgi:hypothetical protein
VKTVKSAAPGRLLTQATGEGRTGAVVVGGAPGGTVYLVEGSVVYAESPAAPGVGALLTSSGRLAARTWQAATEAGSARTLVTQGHLTQGELELCVLGASYDAAYFALSPESGTATFDDGRRHWLGDIVRIDPAALTRESRRRVRLLDEIYPHARLDTAAIVPVKKPPRERVTLTAPQWELLVHADGRRTPADLAQLLGRAGYSTVQELRRLAAAGLVEAPPAVPAKPAALPPAPVRPHPRPLDRREATTVVIPTTAVVSSGDPPPPAKLARRKPGAKLPKEIAAETHLTHQGTDEVLLKRIRTALRALR